LFLKKEKEYGKHNKYNNNYYYYLRLLLEQCYFDIFVYDCFKKRIMDYFGTDQLNHYNNIYHLECHKLDPYFWDYEQAKYAMMEEATNWLN